MPTCVNKLFLKRKMDAFLRQQTLFASTNSAISCLGLNWQNSVQVSSRKLTSVCTIIYKWNSQLQVS
jgi:hypothetical protein